MLLSSLRAASQTASWTAYKPDFFPTNSSGQIHGISRTSQMKFHPSNSLKMYAVSARGGLFISVNGGNNWTIAPGCDNLPLGTRFASVCIDHTNDQIIYLGGGDRNYYSTGSGVWKTTNGGTTFTQTTLNNRIVVDMIIDPTNANVVVAATDNGIYKTTNAGSTWTLKSASGIQFMDLKRKENASSRVLFASTRGAEFYRSNDFGETWTQITSGIFIPSPATTGGGTRLAVTPADSNIVYFVMNARGGTLFKSTDGGTSFTAVKNNILPYLTGYTNDSTDAGQGNYNTGLGVDRTNANIVYFVAHNVWKSTNGGVSWSQLTNWWEKVHTDMHQINTSPYNNGQLWNMNDGGVWLSTDGGNTWTPKSDGIYGIEIYHGGTSPTRRDMVSIGTQDNGELYASSSGWFTNRGGDWQSHCVFDYRSNSSMVYYFLPDWGTVQIPRRRLVTGSSSTYGLPASVTDFSDITYYRGNPDLAFVGDTVVWRTTNLTAGTPAWANILNTNVKIMGMHVNFANPDRLYVITSDQKIWISTNAQAATPTFTTVTLPFSTSSTATITSIKNSPNTIYIATNSRVYRSTDNGSTWTNVTYNLPSYNHERIIADEYFSNNELVFIATGGSVYYKTAAATSWSIYSTGLPSRTTIVDMSIFNDGTNNTLLRAFTYGRGVWETPISNLRTLSANFSADNTKPCIGQAVNFSDNSVGNITTRSWSFPGGSPSTSTASNPVVTYSASGLYTVTLTVSDGISSSTSTQTNYINTQGIQLPVSEGFENATFPPVNWTNVDAGNNAVTWQRYSGAGGFGASSNCMYFDNYNNNLNGAHDEFRSVSIDLTAYNTATLVFDVAYQMYSSSYPDSFQVLVSTNCGASFTSVYLKTGAVLATVAGDNSSPFVPTSGQWRTETVNLNAFTGQTVMLNFRNIGRYGNNLYVDNILLNGTISVNAGPDQSVCQGGSVSIGSAPVPGLTYSWSPATGLSSSAISNPVASPAVTTTYIVTATYPSSGITAKDTVVVNITPGPSVSITPIPSQCVNSSPVGLTGSPAGGTFSGAGVSGAQFFPSTGSGNYVVTYTYSTGSCTSSATTNVTVYPALSVSGIETNASCYNYSDGSVNITPSGGTGTYTYSWSNGATTQDISGIGYGSYTVTVSCPGTGCSITETFIVTHPGLLQVNSFSPTSGASGNTVVISGANFTGVTAVLVNGIAPTSYTVNSTSQITMTVSAAMTSGPITVVCGPCSAVSAGTFTKLGASLSIKAYIQGYMNGTTMRSVLQNQGVSGVSSVYTDTIMVQLRSTADPNIIVDSRKTLMTTTGSAVANFTTVPAGSYWIVIQHRNAIQTWSSSPQALNTTSILYNFSTAASKAYGNNLVQLTPTVWALYSGDVSTGSVAPGQDGFINVSDLQLFENNSTNNPAGYSVHDLNGDNIIDAADYSLLENNVSAGIQVQRP